MFGLDALMRELVEDIAVRSVTDIAPRAASPGAAAEPDDADGGVERIAAADFLEVGGVFLGTAGGNAADAEGQVAHRHSNAEDTGRDFGRLVVKVHPGIRHAGSALCRNRGPELTDWSIVRFQLCAGGASLMQPEPDQMMGNRERMGGKKAVGMLPLVHQGRLGAGEPACVLE